MRKLTLFLAALSLSFCTSAQQQPKTGIVEYEGNHITVEYEYETVAVEDPETGEQKTLLTRSEKLELLNGSRIYQGKEASEPIGSANQLDLKSFIINLLSSELKDADRFFRGLTLVIDEKGKLGYLKTDIADSYMLSIETGPRIEAAKKQRIQEAISEKLHSKAFIPAKKDGKAVAYEFHLSGNY